ncbi:MAG: hypothetical protein IT249_20805 [Chitinophagaceae bacterium]|nr:hypothetical protein [Chitinophagaceae bacterium]
MRTKLFRVTLCIVIAATTIFSRCKKGLSVDCTESRYTFNVPINIYPDDEIIHINDTIWFECDFLSNQTDLQTNTIINYSNAENLGTGLSLLKLTGGDVSDPGAIAAANEFGYVIKNGVFIQGSSLPDQGRTYNFSELNNTYKFKLGAVAQQKGDYLIGVGNASNVYTKDDECTKAAFIITIANTDQHLNIYQQNRPGYVLSDYEQTHVYCFKVE